MIRDHTVGSATAMLAASEARPPRISRLHGNNPPRRPWRASDSSGIDAAATVPSTGSGNRAARQAGSPL
ncbi:hypothetical protein F4561_002097 [Lipingzhangella halophila]|uniref:Uncharacterized protein n=1 Tax=Lipingzhangella halophila TaxID=1783352 RepID=A0A7W7RG10_9ACTN|nr:hypothetical protein [Lipingzhangella halophila]MBB4931277.1 hypothetical protein [Lipingzhangella halophila]